MRDHVSSFKEERSESLEREIERGRGESEKKWERERERVREGVLVVEGLLGERGREEVAAVLKVLADAKLPQ